MHTYRHAYTHKRWPPAAHHLPPTAHSLPTAHQYLLNTAPPRPSPSSLDPSPFTRPQTKLEEIYAPTVDDFVDISANTYTRSEVIEYEMKLSQALDWQLTSVTTFKFIERFLKAAQSNPKDTCFVWYLSKLVLQEQSFVGLKPSMVAAAILNLARQTTCCRGNEVWTKTIQYYTRYSPADLEDVVRKMHLVHLHAWDGKYTSIRTRYSRADKFHVAQCVICLREEALSFEDTNGFETMVPKVMVPKAVAPKAVAPKAVVPKAVVPKAASVSMVNGVSTAKSVAASKAVAASKTVAVREAIDLGGGVFRL